MGIQMLPATLLENQMPKDAELLSNLYQVLHPVCMCLLPLERRKKRPQ